MVMTTHAPEHVPFGLLVKAMRDCDVAEIKRFAAIVTTDELHSIVRIAFAHRLPDFRRTRIEDLRRCRNVTLCGAVRATV